MIPGSRMFPGTQDCLILLPDIFHISPTPLFISKDGYGSSKHHIFTEPNPQTEQKGHGNLSCTCHFLMRKENILSEPLGRLPLSVISQNRSVGSSQPLLKAKRQDSGIFSHYLELGSRARKMGGRRAAEWAIDLPCRTVLRRKCEKRCRNPVELIPFTTHM